MELRVIRDRFTKSSSTGELYVDGYFECFTLEDADRRLEENPDGKIYGQTAIPRGRYRVVVSMSNRFKRLLPEIIHVPGFEGIRIHPGNAPADTHGCILVGANRSTDYITDSKISFSALFDKIMEAWEQEDEIWIEIE